MASSSQSLRFFWSKNLHWRDGSYNPSLLSQCTKRSEDYVVLDDSPTIVNWNGLDLTEQAEITPTLDTANNWIIFTHPLGTEDTATPTPPIPKGAQRILYTKGKAGRERGWWRTGTDKLASYGLPARTPKCGLIRTARFPTQISSLWMRSSTRNPQKIFQICDPRGQNRSTGRARSQA